MISYMLKYLKRIWCAVLNKKCHDECDCTIKKINMLGTLISSVSNLASSYIEGKTAIQKAEATIRMKEATGEIDWDLVAMRASQSSWKDEWLTLLFSIPLVLSFMGEWGRGIVADGFTALAGMPQWYQIALGAIVSASFATRSASKLFNCLI